MALKVNIQPQQDIDLGPLNDVAKFLLGDTLDPSNFISPIGAMAKTGGKRTVEELKDLLDFHNLIKEHPARNPANFGGSIFDDYTGKLSALHERAKKAKLYSSERADKIDEMLMNLPNSKDPDFDADSILNFIHSNISNAIDKYFRTPSRKK